MDTQDLTANSNISSVALKYIQNQEKTLQIQPNNSNTLERVPSEDSFVSSNKKTIVTGIVATLLTLTGFAYMAKKGLFGEKLQNFIENIFKKQTPPTNIDTKNLEKNSSSKIIPDTDNKIKPQQPSSQVDDKIIPQQPLVQGNDKITQQPSSQVDEAPVAPKNNLQSPSLEDLKTGTTILDKKKIAYDLCKDEFTAEWVSKLNDEEFEKAKKLMEKGCFENAHIAAKLQGEDYEKALELADLGYKGCHLDEIAVLQGEDFSHAKELIQKGVKYNIDTIAKLRGTNYEQALVLADKKVDNYELFKIASLDSNSFKKVMALSQNDEASKVIRKDATEQEHRFAKTILYGEDFKKIHYNYQEDFLELSYDEVLKAKDYLKRGLEYYTIPSLTHLDEKQAARADIVLNMPQFKEGRQVVYLAQLEDEQFQKAL
ncbi:hypothetical protein IJ670_07535, partial [bacterium]|nr:hypothetical protein [bacterium]